MTLICDKNIFGTKNDNLKFHPAEKITPWLDAHKYSDYNVAIICSVHKKYKLMEYVGQFCFTIF